MALFCARSRIDQVADALLQDVLQFAGELGLNVDSLGAGTQRRKGVRDRDNGLADGGQGRSGHGGVGQGRGMNGQAGGVEHLLGDGDRAAIDGAENVQVGGCRIDQVFAVEFGRGNDGLDLGTQGRKFLVQGGVGIGI